jgi:SPASM domain peptide maturase of grasp-with-spasm system
MFFKLYSHNIAVWGKEKSAIYDLKNQTLLRIPNIVYRLLKELETDPIAVVQQRHAADNPALFQPYIDYLIRQDVGFLTQNPEFFPPLDLHYESSSVLTTAVLEHDGTGYQLTDVLDSLDELRCEQVELRLTNTDIRTLESLLAHARASVFRGITLYIAYHPSLAPDQLERLVGDHPKINRLVVYQSPFPVQHNGHSSRVLFTQQNLEQTAFRAAFSQHRYFINVKFFAESLHRHSYFNQKVCVDKSGFIRNSLLSDQHFGRVSEQRLQEVVLQSAFQKLWFARVDEIEGICDSELRYALLLTDQLEELPSGRFRIRSAEHVAEGSSVGV